MHEHFAMAAPPRLRRWLTETTDRLERVPWPERRRIAELPPDRAHYDELLMSLPLFGKIEARLPPRPRFAKDRIRVGFMPLGPAPDLHAVAGRLAWDGLDVVLLPGVDVGMRRSGNLHDAAVLADGLDMGYAFAADAVRLPDSGPTAGGLGPDADLYGLLGGAILFGPVLHRLGALRVDMTGRWFTAARERRLGGTIALFAQCLMGPEPVTLVTLALDPGVPIAERRRQIVAALEQLDAYDPLSPALVALDPGDDLADALAGRRRFALPLGRRDPLAEAFLKRGFKRAAEPSGRCGIMLARKLACDHARIVSMAGQDGPRAAAGDLIGVEIGLP